MTKIYLFATVLFFYGQLFGQIEKDVNAVLGKRDYNVFKQFVSKYRTENLSSTKMSFAIRPGNIRDIAPGFQEAVFYIEKSYPFGQGGYIGCNSRVHLIRLGNLIVYFYLERKELKGLPKSFDYSTDTTYTFSDKKGMEALKKSFREMYSSELNEKELFIDTIYYGQQCGYSGEKPVEQAAVDNWIRKLDAASLKEWLQSTNTEKQIYAVQGFYFLTMKGVAISAELKRTINYILHKKGTINTCMVCDSREEDIFKVVKQFLLQ